MASKQRSPLEIIADIFEERGGVPARLRARGALVVTRRMRVGDYAVGGETIVERKTVQDLHSTIERGRFWAQIGGLRDGCRYPFLLVEGHDIDDGPVLPAAIRGACLTTIRLGVRFLQSRDADDSAQWVLQLAALCQASGSRDRPTYAQRPQPRPQAAVAEAVLAAVPGISRNRARALLGHFGSVGAVLGATQAELMAVDGIGPERAQRIADVLTLRGESSS